MVPALGNTNKAGSHPGYDPVLYAALNRAIPADLRAFAATIGLESFLATSPNDIVGVLRSMKSMPGTGNSFPIQVIMWLRLCERLVVDHFTKVWGNARWHVAPPAGWFVPGAGTVRLFGGAKGSAPYNRDLADAGMTKGIGDHHLHPSMMMQVFSSLSEKDHMVTIHNMVGGFQTGHPSCHLGMPRFGKPNHSSSTSVVDRHQPTGHDYPIELVING